MVQERKPRPTAHHLSFHLELDAALIRYAEDLRRRKRWYAHPVIREIPTENMYSFLSQRLPGRRLPNC